MVTTKFLLHAMLGSGSATLMSVLNNFSAVDAMTLEIAFYGGLGGLTRWVGLKEPWLDGLRIVVLAVIMSVGVGVLWPLFTDYFFGETPEHLINDPRAAWGGAYIIGVLSTSIFAWLINRAVKFEKGDDDA